MANTALFRQILTQVESQISHADEGASAPTKSWAKGFLADRAKSEINAAAAAWSSVAGRVYNYASNYAMPNLVLPPDDCIRQFHCGQTPTADYHMDPATLAEMLQYNGIPFFPQREDRASTDNWKAWKKHIALSRPDLGLDAYWEIYRRGLVYPAYGIPLSMVEDKLAREGITGQRKQLWLSQMNLFDVGTIIQLWREGKIDDARAMAMLNSAGWRLPEQREQILYGRRPPGIGDLNLLRNRGIINKPEWDALVKIHGLHDHGATATDRDLADQLRAQWPGIGVAITAAMRGGWSGLADRLKLWDGRDPAADKLLLANGYQAGLGEPVKRADGTLMGRDYRDFLWMVDRPLPGAGQLCDWIAKFRPQRMLDWRNRGYFGGDLAGYVGLTPDRMREWLTAGGWTPECVEMAVAACCREIPARMFGRALALGINQLGNGQPIDGPFIERKLLGEGYCPEDAEVLARQIYRQGQKAIYGPTVECFKKMAIAQYQLGTWSGDQLLTQLQANGDPPDLAIKKLQCAGVEVQTETIKAIIAVFRKEYLSGRISSNDCYNLLISSGIRDPRATQYVQLWTLQLTPPRKEFSASKIVHYLCKGWISDATAKAWLSNLGYNPVQIGLILADAGACIANVNAKIEEALHKKTVAAHKAAVAAAKALDAAKAKAVAQLKSQIPPALLKKMASRGEITEDDVVERLRLYGWGEDAILVALADIEDMKNAIAAKEKAPAFGKTAVPINPDPTAVGESASPPPLGSLGSTGPSLPGSGGPA